ncbi:hypothetical protein KDA00_01300 [Candidatus Saccharibacteria bacterium]|nr:hypothetical protein [Candidatus Saccharibacteria bacterium]
MIGLIAQAVSPETFMVSIDIEFIIPVVYVVPFFLGALLRHYVPKIFALILASIFIICLSFMLFVMYQGQIWRYILPIIAILGIVMGLSSWLRHLMKKIKMLGDDDSWLT